MPLPSDGRVLRPFRVDAIGTQRTAARPHDAARVVVHTEEIQRALVAVELAGAIEIRLRELPHVPGRTPAEKRIGETDGGGGGLPGRRPGRGGGRSPPLRAPQG